MKTILYNPIFINPQAYYVFPRLTRYLQPDNESTAEPANYIGTIEVKVIAYGDTTLKRTYTNTDSIDLSEFKNTWIRISLFTKVGSCVLGEWKIGNMESDLPYIDPEVLASLKAVVIVGNKTNNDSDRAIIKNLVDPDNPFIISNAAFKLNSGFGKYEEDFTDWRIYPNIKVTDSVVTTDGNFKSSWFIYKHSSESKINEMNIKVSGIPKGGKILYFYISDETANMPIAYTIPKDGIYHLPESKINNNRASVGFTVESSYDWNNIRIEQIPSFEGAFVTDGVDDLITSTKTVQEMLGGSNELTIVSMVHQVKDSANNVSFTNYIRGSANGYFRNIVNNYDKTGIYGYTSSDLMGLSVVNNILGDKNDYTSNGDNRDSIINGNFSVQGYSYNDGNNTGDFSSVAWYWTIIANKVLTTDQINQVIDYFNLDRTLNPDILCNTIKQGITNENHAEFGDKLIDFSGNGRDIQLNNLAWKGGSGIAAKQYETFKDWTNTPYQTSTVTEIDEFTRVVDSTSNAYWVSMINRTSDFDKVHDSINIVLYQDDMLLVHECKYKIDENVTTKALYETLKSGVNTITLATIDKFTDIPEDAEIMSLGEWVNPKSNKGSVKITLLPSYEGGVLLDGINDFGKVTGMPIYKDYTFIIDYERISYTSEGWGGAIVSKSPIANNGAFISMMANSAGLNKQLFSFGGVTAFIKDDLSRILFWQTKYKSENTELTVGEGVDGDTLWLGTLRDNDSRFFNGVIYSLMSFPYSMSEFLIERQLKKYKLGTLYPNMVEFRPIVKSNSEYTITAFSGSTPMVIGSYYPINTPITFHVKPKGLVDEVVKLTINGKETVFNKVSGTTYIYDYSSLPKSPQKIDITIDEYIRYEDIVQPYPEMWVITQNAKKVSWGDKLKVGSEFGYNSKINLLSGLYSTANSYYNGKVVKAGDVLKVEKQMVFACDYSWIGGTNEPKCILSPSRLRIPNSSYKILGYIPDISGHGNHGVIHNSAYALNSGANGYTEDFTKWTLYTGVKCTDSIISLDSSFNKQDQWILFKPKGSNINQFTINIKGIPDGGNLYLRLSTDSSIKLENGINEISSYTNVTNSTGFFIGANGLNLDWSNLVIEQVGEYEGAYCLDGVDDFVTIPTTVGGKQVLMKVNWDKTIADAILYDQRGYPNEFAIYNADNDNSGNPVFAYQARNNGQTYIDGILNKNIKASELRAITHNITITNELQAGVNQSYAVIGSNRVNDAYFTKMALYDFMLFDEISTDDKIKELNEYVGIEGNT